MSCGLGSKAPSVLNDAFFLTYCDRDSINTDSWANGQDMTQPHPKTWLTEKTVMN